MDIKDRIKQYLEFKGISDYRFEKDMSLSKGYANKSKNPTSDVLMKMCGIYTDMSAEWLLRGEGEMLKNQDELANEHTSPVLKTSETLMKAYSNFHEKESFYLDRISKRDDELLEARKSIREMEAEIEDLRARLEREAFKNKSAEVIKSKAL